MFIRAEELAPEIMRFVNDYSVLLYEPDKWELILQCPPLRAWQVRTDFAMSSSVTLTGDNRFCNVLLCEPDRWEQILQCPPLRAWQVRTDFAMSSSVTLTGENRFCNVTDRWNQILNRPPQRPWQVRTDFARTFSIKLKGTNKFCNVLPVEPDRWEQIVQCLLEMCSYILYIIEAKIDLKSSE